MVIDQANDPGLEVPPARHLDEERALDVDEPERVRARTLVARAALARARGPAGAQVVEEPLDPPLADIGDLTPAQLRPDPLGVPIGRQAHSDHDQFDPRRMLEPRDARSTTFRAQREHPATLVRRLPAEQAGSTAATERERSAQTVLAHRAHPSRPFPDQSELVARHRHPRRAAAARREEAEARSLLIRVSEPAAVWVIRVAIGGEDLVRHTTSSLPRPDNRVAVDHDFIAVSETTGNLI